MHRDKCQHYSVTNGWAAKQAPVQLEYQFRCVHTHIQCNHTLPIHPTMNNKNEQNRKTESENERRKKIQRISDSEVIENADVRGAKPTCRNRM